MYHNQQGIAMCCGYLKLPNVWKQLVAANLPGFWVQEQRIELQVALFWALCERMYGAGKDAESALNSIACLAQSWNDMPKSKPYPFLINDPATTTNIVDTLVHLIFEPLRPTLLFQLRAFEACCRNYQVLQHIYGGRSPHQAQEECHQLQAMVAGKQLEESTSVSLKELCCKLLKYVSEKGIQTTTKIYAGNALLSLLCYGTGELTEEAIKSLQGPVEEYIAPAKAHRGAVNLPYFWLNEMILVEKMRKKLAMPSYGNWQGVRIRSPDGMELSSEEAIAFVEAL
ncbi:hypothetical protein L7F22_043013 [Adiantum nelumboides]|nr:hypothetical protein [Adiantum nelumboides]